MNHNSGNIGKGDIFLYDFGQNPGSIQCGKRPVMVLQDGRTNENSPVTVIAAITSIIKKSYMPSHVYLGRRFGLDSESQLLLEQIFTVNKSDFIKKIGTVDDEDVLKEVARGLKKQFGLWSYKKEHTEKMRCLCGKCANEYRACDEYIVRRVDPFDNSTESCQRCGRPGHDYIVYKKSQTGRAVTS